MVYSFKKIESNLENVWRFEVIIEDEVLGIIQIYNAQIPDLGFWYDSNKGSYGLDFMVTNELFLEKNLALGIAENFLKRLFKLPQYADVLDHPQLNSLNDLQEFWGADYRIRKKMLAPQSGAYLLEIFWTE